MGFNDGTLIFSYAFFVSSLQENTLMRRIASILSDLTHTTTDCSAVQPQQGRLHSCLVALDKATGDQEKQQEREFGMILEPRAEQLTTGRVSHYLLHVPVCGSTNKISGPHYYTRHSSSSLVQYNVV